MGFLGFGKKDKVIDLTTKYKKDMEKAEQMKAIEKNQESSSFGSKAMPFSFFDSPAATTSSTDTSSSEDVVDIRASHEKKRKLAKRIMDMTERLEDISNQIYHLQQRVEVLERKLDIRRV